MGFWKNAALLAGGALAGYLASRSSQTTAATSTELETRPEHVIEKFVGQDGSLAKFLDSKYGAPFKSSALNVLRFAANVKAGMDEKEAELKQRFEDQKQDPRPGSVDSWSAKAPELDDPQPAREHYEVIDSTFAAGHLGESDRDELNRKRLARDAQLGKDFFS